MKWLEIPAHRVLEVERHELTSDFDVYDEAGEKLCAAHRTYYSVRRMARGLSSPSSVISKA
jgi:hypothetical protein